jgi:hypothetical protein
MVANGTNFPHSIFRFCLALSLAIVQTLATAAQDTQQQTKMVTVEKGQLLELVLMTPLSSGTAREGDEFSLRLNQPLVSSGKTVLPQNWIVFGRITKVVRAGKDCKSGAVKWELEDAAAADGSRIELRLVFAYRSKTTGELVETTEPRSLGSRVGRKVLAVPAFAAYFLIMTPYIILETFDPEPSCKNPGQEMSVPAGSVYHAAVVRSVRVTVPPQRTAAE